jgi:hypothetical protein
MSIRRFYSIKGSTITDAFEYDLSTRSTTANMGRSDVLECFTVYNQDGSGSNEIARIIIQFDMLSVWQGIYSGSIPSSSTYYLKMSNVAHRETLPTNYNLELYMVSGSSWTGGNGLDMELYTYSGSGVSWYSASNETAGTAWQTAGGDYYNSPAISQSFTNGDEDLEVNITSACNKWIENAASGSNRANYGLIIKFPSGSENGQESYYVKKFFSSGSQYYFKRPYIEARFDDAITDDRGNFYASSSLVSDIKNKLYFYNNPRGNYVNVPTVPLTVVFFDEKNNGNRISADEGTSVTASLETTGKYYITCSVNTSEEIIYDRWYDGNSICVHTGTIDVNSLAASTNSSVDEYVITISKLKSVYKRNETNARFDLFVRKKDWSPTIYTVANATVENKIIENAFYQVKRSIDGLTIIDFNDDSKESATKLSYDSGGNYFNLDMTMFEPDYLYEIIFAFKINGSLRIQEDRFKFKVES